MKTTQIQRFSGVAIGALLLLSLDIANFWLGVPFIKAIPQEWQGAIAILSAVVVLVSAYQALVLEVRSGNDEGYNRILQLLCPIKGHDEDNQETTIVHKLLEIRVGKDAADALLSKDGGDTFPLTLVAGGDIALVMGQAAYGQLLSKLLKLAAANDWGVRWTTFAPFELFNRGLAYEGDDWEKRTKKGSATLAFKASKNEDYYDFIHQWLKVGDGKQIVILANPKVEGTHPLSWDKYQQGGEFNGDLLKYLVVRYHAEERTSFISSREEDFVADSFRQAVKQQDQASGDKLSWIALDTVREIVGHNDIKGIYNYDMVYFRGHGDTEFCLVRVDPTNYAGNKGGAVGVTFVIFTSCNLHSYHKFFEKLSPSAKPTFTGLTQSEL